MKPALLSPLEYFSEIISEMQFATGTGESIQCGLGGTGHWPVLAGFQLPARQRTDKRGVLPRDERPSLSLDWVADAHVQKIVFCCPEVTMPFVDSLKYEQIDSL
jgi:hypothetical protein